MLYFNDPNQLILIGPSGVGKTTVGTRIAAIAECPFTSLDALERGYIIQVGYDVAHAEVLKESPIPFARYHYRRTFFDVAVDKFLQDNTQGVLELGAGHPIVPNAEKQAYIKKRLAPYPRVVLLLPTSNLQDSIRIIRERNQRDISAPDINEIFIVDDTYMELAKYIVYTDRKAPEEICDEIINMFDEA